MWKHAKNSMKVLKRPNSVFLQGDVRSSVLKTQKTRKTRETKTRIAQNFLIVWPIQGCTMSKSMPRAFRKCGTFRYKKVLNQSYWLSKSGQIWRKKFSEWRRHKKKTRLQYCTEGRHMNRIGFSHGKFDILFISGLKTAYWSRVFFFWRQLFLMTNSKFQTPLTLTSHNSGSKHRSIENHHIFRFVRTSAFTWCSPCRVYEIRMSRKCGKHGKIPFFMFLSVPTVKKSWRPAFGQFWCYRTSPWLIWTDITHIFDGY